jgi:hypothetical protein
VTTLIASAVVAFPLCWIAFLNELFTALRVSGGTTSRR